MLNNLPKKRGRPPGSKTTCGIAMQEERLPLHFSQPKCTMGKQRYLDSHHVEVEDKCRSIKHCP